MSCSRFCRSTVFPMHGNGSSLCSCSIRCLLHATHLLGAGFVLHKLCPSVMHLTDCTCPVFVLLLVLQDPVWPCTAAGWMLCRHRCRGCRAADTLHATHRCGGERAAVPCSPAASCSGAWGHTHLLQASARNAALLPACVASSSAPAG